MTKKIKQNLCDKIEIRVSTFEKNRLKHFASIYCGGNLSLFIISCALNCPRELLKTDKQFKNRNRKKAPHTERQFLCLE